MTTTVKKRSNAGCFTSRSAKPGCCSCTSWQGRPLDSARPASARPQRAPTASTDFNSEPGNARTPRHAPEEGGRGEVSLQASLLMGAVAEVVERVTEIALASGILSHTGWQRVWRRQCACGERDRLPQTWSTFTDYLSLGNGNVISILASMSCSAGVSDMSVTGDISRMPLSMNVTSPLKSTGTSQHYPTSLRRLRSVSEKVLKRWGLRSCQDLGRSGHCHGPLWGFHVTFCRLEVRLSGV